MAEYIDKSEVLELKRDYGEGQYSMMLIDPALVKKLPPADVVEREKIDKAIEEISNIDWEEIIMNYDDVEIGLKDKAEEILKRNIGETE